MFDLVTRGAVAFRTVSAYSLSKVGLLFRTGLGQWIGLTVFVVYDSWSGVRQAYRVMSPRPAFASVSETVGTSYESMVGALEAAPEVTGVAALAELWVFVVALATILWYSKFWVLVAKKIQGIDYSPVLVGIFAVTLYGALAWAWTGTVPVFDDLDVWMNLPDLLDVPGRERLVEWLTLGAEDEMTGVVNESVNGSAGNVTNPQ